MRNTIIVIDTDSARKAAVARALGQEAYVIPVDSLEEIAPQWPEDAIVIASSADGCAEATLARLEREGRVYPLILLGEPGDGARMAALMPRGFIGMIDWRAGAETLPAQLAAYAPLIERRIAAQRIERRARKLIARLSEREIQVLGAMSHGQTNKEIANTLEISPRTVEIHRSHAITKLQASNSHSASRIYFEATCLGLLAHCGTPDAPRHGEEFRIAA